MSSSPNDSAKVFGGWRYAYPEHPAPARTRWMTGAPSIFVGSWEELAFRRRAGLGWTDETTAYRDEFTDEVLDRIVAMGCNHLVLPHTKGYGLKAVGAEIDYHRDVIQRSHQRKLRIGLYLRLDSVIPEILRSEYPDVDEWLTAGELGRQSYYSAGQTFRSRICHLHPSAMRYLENEMRFAVDEMKADLLHFDGMHFSFYPFETCRCSRCTAAYRQWLKQRYADESERAEFFGPVDFDTIPMPRFDPLQQAADPGFAPFRGLGDLIRSPDIQSWYRFRWDGELALVRHLRRFVRQLNPDVAISINPAWGGCYNSYRVFTTWAERMLPWVDAVWSEDPLHVSYEHDRLISRIGTYKTAREHDISVCNYHWMREPGRLEASLALSSASNGGNLACMGFTIRHLPHYTIGEEIKRKFAEWVGANWRLFQNTRPAGEIALLRHQPSLAWNSRSPWWTAIACEQLLVRMQVPWRMFDDLTATKLASVKTLLMPEAFCLSDDELKMLESWIRDGGRAFVTCATASHNQDMRRRARNPFAAWVPGWRAALDKGNAADRWFDWIEDPAGIDQHSAAVDPTIAELDRGRIGLWPQIRTRGQKSSAYHTLGPDEWWPPAQADELAAFIHRLHGDFALQLQAPPHVVVEQHRRAEDGTDFVHLVQVKEQANPIDLAVTGEVVRGRRVHVHALDAPPPTYALEGDTLSLRGVRRYTVVELVANQK